LLLIVHYQLMGKGCEATSVFVGRILGLKAPLMTQSYAHLSPGTMAAAGGNKLDWVFTGAMPRSV
jgi:hypothetical protein